MGRKEVLAERRALEEYYYNCKLETPEEVAKLFEVYTRLIWNHHQAGLVYDYYCDSTTMNHEGAEKLVGGVAVTEEHTLPALPAFSRNVYEFFNITCTGDPEHGYHFGQVTTKRGVYVKEGFTSAGLGDGRAFQGGEEWTFCECFVNKVNGRWMITDEFLCSGDETVRRRKAGSRPFCKTVLDNVQSDQPEPAAEACDESQAPVQAEITEEG